MFGFVVELVGFAKIYYLSKMRKQIELVCPYCTKSYHKDLSEYNRNQKLQRESYCGLSCFRKAKPLQPKNPYQISKHSANRGDQYTPFRYIFKCINNSKRKDCHITLIDLKEQWELQKGICAYTKISMILPTHTNSKISSFKAASLDRIDSDLPYQEGNIQFILRAINYMKNKSSHQETIDFLNLLKEQ